MCRGGKGILCSEEKTFTLSTVDNMRVCMSEIAFQLSGDRDNPSVSVSDKAYCLPANPMSDRGQSVCVSTVVRRLTPVECERLQGFPDNYTNIPWRGKDTAPDSRRYKALGNSMAVPVMRWIGKRMMEVKTVVCDEDAIDSILYVTPSDDGQLSLF